jgi:S-adenosylmethionine decarboxylase
MSTANASPPPAGIEWIVDAHGCAPERLRDPAALSALFQRIVEELGLKPAAAPLFHQFPPPGGVTGMLLLMESHLTCHTFPESGLCAMNLYCCRPRREWPWAERLAQALGAARVEARAVSRPQGLVGAGKGAPNPWR